MELKDIKLVIQADLLMNPVPEWIKWVFIDDDGWLMGSDQKPSLKRLSEYHYYWEYPGSKGRHQVKVITTDLFEWLAACEDYEADGPYDTVQIETYLLYNIEEFIEHSD
jgi:hypothetical protein